MFAREAIDSTRACAGASLHSAAIGSIWTSILISILTEACSIFSFIKHNLAYSLVLHHVRQVYIYDLGSGHAAVLAHHRMMDGKYPLMNITTFDSKPVIGFSPGRAMLASFAEILRFITALNDR